MTIIVNKRVFLQVCAFFNLYFSNSNNLISYEKTIFAVCKQDKQTRLCTSVVYDTSNGFNEMPSLIIKTDINYDFAAVVVGAINPLEARNS